MYFYDIVLNKFRIYKIKNLAERFIIYLCFIFSKAFFIFSD